MSSIVDLVFEQSLVNDSLANTAYWGRLWTDCGQTCCSVIDCILQLKHAAAAKKSDINKTTKHYKSLVHIKDKYRELCTELLLCYHPYLVSLFFTDLLYLVTYLMFLSLCFVCFIFPLRGLPQ